MACCLFTYHAHGTWLPDRPQGYVHWKHGLQPADKSLDDSYRRNMREPAAAFDDVLQRLIIDELRIASQYQRFRTHAIATEPTHVHLLASWPDDRLFVRLSDGIHQSISRRLKKEHPRRKWLTKGGSRRQVKNREHFDYLIETYLPSHRGWKWDDARGLYH